MSAPAGGGSGGGAGGGRATSGGAGGGGAGGGAGGGGAGGGANGSPAPGKGQGSPHPAGPGGAQPGAPGAGPADANGAASPGATPAGGSDGAADGTPDGQSKADTPSEEDAVRRAVGGAVARRDAADALGVLADKLAELAESSRDARVVNFFTSQRDVNVGAGDPAGAREPGAAEPADLTPIDADHVRDLRRVHVRSASFDRALGILTARHVVVLAGDQGTGRDAAAIALLAQRLGDDTDDHVHRLSPSALADGTWSVPRSGIGVVALAQASAFHVDDAWLTRTSAALRQAGSFLVVITDALPDALFDATHRRAYVVERFAAPDATEVLVQRVADGLGLPRADVERSLHAEGALEALEHSPFLRHAVRIAMLAVEWLPHGDGRLRAELADMFDPAAIVREWFQRVDDPVELALVVAVAVLDGSTYLTVSDAAVQLHRMLDAEDDDPVRELADALRDVRAREQGRAPGRDARAAAGAAAGTSAVRVRLRDAVLRNRAWLDVGQPGDATSAPAVRYRSQQVQLAVLRHVWFELDGMRPALLRWLRLQVMHDDQDAKARAAFAAGVLAMDDLQHSLRRFLWPWSADGSEELRRGAALTLSTVATDPRHAERVWSILDDFAGFDPEAADTAARAAGGPVGLQQPERALGLLRTIGRDRGIALLDPFVLSIVQLTQNGRAAEVVRALLTWTEPGKHAELRLMSLVAFVVVAVEPATRTRGLGAAGAGLHVLVDATDLPVLVRDARLYHDELPELWGRALSHGVVRDIAVAALNSLVRYAVDVPSAYPVVLDVLAGIADRSDTDMGRLEYHLDRWAEDDDEPLPAAGRLLDDLLEVS